MNIEQFIQQHVSRCIESLYGDTGGAPVQIQKTRKEFEGDMTLVVFPLLKLSRKSPEATAEEIGSALVGAVPEISGYNVVKGFLNISLCAPLLGRTAERNSRHARLRPPCGQRSHGHGRVLLAEHEQAAAFGARAQQPARLLRVADTRSRPATASSRSTS